MSYLQELRDHYKAVRQRIRAAALPPKPTQMLLPPPQEEVAESPPTGVVPKNGQAEMVSEALKAVNPQWIGGNHAQAMKIANEMVSAPKLPPLPGLNLDEPGSIRWARVLQAVAAYHDIDPMEILGPSRKRHVIAARFEVFYRLRVDLNFSYTKIGTLMKKDHSTIMHGVSKVREKLLDQSAKAEDDGMLVHMV